MIVLGFVIGAGLSLARRNASTVAFASPTPVQSLPPVTPAPTEKPTPLPTDAPTDIPTETPSNPPSGEPSTSASAEVTARATTEASEEAKTTASAAASAEPSASAAPTATPAAKTKAKSSPAATHSVITHPVATAAPVSETEAPVATPQATRTPHVPVAKTTAVAAGSAVASPADAATDFPRLAAAVVRQYLVAVSRGDQDSAYAALGGSPGDRGVQLTEAGIVDARTKIGTVESRGTGDTATVTVDLHTPDGLYYGQYTVRRNDTGAAVIVQHSISK